MFDFANAKCNNYPKIKIYQRTSKMNEEKQQSQSVAPEQGLGTFTRRAWMTYLAIGLLCVFPAISFFRRTKRKETVITETTVFSKPAGQFGVFRPSDNEDHRKVLNMIGNNNRFIKVTGVRFVEFYEDACDVMLEIEFVGEVFEEARYQFELKALDLHGNVIESAWLETHDKRLIAQMQNESEYAKRYGRGFLPIMSLNFGYGMSRVEFDKIAWVELSTTRILL